MTDTMPHIIREHDIGEICSNCKKPHGRKDVEIIFHHHKTYEVITCQNCNYKTMKVRPETLFSEKYDFM